MFTLLLLSCRFFRAPLSSLRGFFCIYSVSLAFVAGALACVLVARVAYPLVFFALCACTVAIFKMPASAASASPRRRPRSRVDGEESSAPSPAPFFSRTGRTICSAIRTIRFAIGSQRSSEVSGPSRLEARTVRVRRLATSHPPLSGPPALHAAATSKAGWFQ